MTLAEAVQTAWERILPEYSTRIAVVQTGSILAYTGAAILWVLDAREAIEMSAIRKVELGYVYYDVGEWLARKGLHDPALWSACDKSDKSIAFDACFLANALALQGRDILEGRMKWVHECEAFGFRQEIVNDHELINALSLGSQ